MGVCRRSASEHCCWINGEVCKFAEYNNSNNTISCNKWDSIGDADWQRAPVGQWFMKNHPGYDCRDWPQKIPAVMAMGIGLCCWQGEE